MADTKAQTDNFSLEEDDIFEDFETAGAAMAMPAGLELWLVHVRAFGLALRLQPALRAR
jgi:hypothetical protein